jgi:dipeptidyl aminopeptidase/acylaminoacyl peptidase
MDILPTKRGLKWQKVPLIVVPHGGPQGVRDSWNYIAEDQLFASRGYATLHVNFRISEDLVKNL